MTHNMDSSNKSKLDNEWRRQNLPPYRTLEVMGLSPADTVADIGCGIGYFTIAMADIVDKKNKIYALDVSEEMLEDVERKAKIAGLNNIITVQAEDNDLKLPDGICSFAFVANVLHEIVDKEGFVSRIKNIIKPGGRLALIEWIKKPTPKGPPVEHRIDKEYVMDLLKQQNFNIESIMEFSGHFYGIIALKL